MQEKNSLEEDVNTTASLSSHGDNEAVVSSIPETIPLSPEDLLRLDNAQLRKKLAAGEVEKAMLKVENSELLYKNTVIQLTMKYGLTKEDVISPEKGIIIKGVKK